jgi:3-oxoacyl-ACP reductase-like protein
VLLKDTPGQIVIADKGYDAQARVVQPLLDKGKEVVIPSRSTSKQPREYGRHLYKGMCSPPPTLPHCVADKLSPCPGESHQPP